MATTHDTTPTDDPHGIVWESPRERRPFANSQYVVGRADDHHGLDWMGFAAFETTEQRDAAEAHLRSLGFNYCTRFSPNEIHNDGQRGWTISWGRYGPSKMRRCASERLPSVKKAQREERAREAFWAHELKYHRSSYDPC